MRAMGVALDKATLQQTLYENGINRTYDSLTRAQKTELLYYQIMTQTSKMQGELGRTMTSPANMARIMKQEFSQLGRAIGTIFIPIAMKIIPVVRAITQELIKLARWLGGKAGYEETDYLYDYSDGLTEISGGLGDIEDSATDAAKAMNKMLMPFDELNNINFSSESGSGNGIAGGAGDSLFDKLPSYDIFKGLSDDMNKKVEEYKAKIESLIPVAKALGAAIASAFAFKKLIEFLNWAEKAHNTLFSLGKLGGLIEIGFGTILSITGIWAMWKGTKKLLKGDYSIWAILETIGGTAVGTFGIATILRGIYTMGRKELPLGKALTIGMGIMLLIQSFEVIKHGVETGNINKIITGIVEGGIGLGALTWNKNAGFASKVIILSLAIETVTTFSRWADENSDYIREKFFDGKSEEELTWYENFAVGINAVGKGVNDTIANLTGFNWANTVAGIEDIGVAFDNDSKYLKDFRENLDNISASYDNLKQSILDNYNAKLRDMEILEDYLPSLDRIIDENGHVKQGYTELAEYILGEYSEAFGDQYELIDGVIYKNGEVITSYQEFRDNIDKNIQKIKEEAEQAANLSLYEEAYKQRKKLATELHQLEIDNQQAEIDYQQALDEGWDTESKKFKKVQQHLFETSKAKSELTKQSIKNDKELLTYEIEAFGLITNKIDEENSAQEQFLQDLFINNREAWKKTYDAHDKDEQEAMIRMISKIKDTIPGAQEAWKELAEKYPEEFGKAYDDWSIDTQKSIEEAEKKIKNNNLPKNSAETARLVKNRFNDNFDLSSIVTTKINEGANAITNNSGVVVTATQGMTNQVYAAAQMDTTWIGKNVAYGIADGIKLGTLSNKLASAAQNLVNKVFNLFTNKNTGFDIESPSKLMRDEVGYWLPLGVAEGIDKGAYAVEDSVENLINKTRVDMQDFNFATSGDLVSNINGSISAKISASLSENTFDNMADATYQGMARALIENNEDYNPQFNVYVGNDKVYSGFGIYQSNESNRYGVKV